MVLSGRRLIYSNINTNSLGLIAYIKNRKGRCSLLRLQKKVSTERRCHNQYQWLNHKKFSIPLEQGRPDLPRSSSIRTLNPYRQSLGHRHRGPSPYPGINRQGIQY